MNKKIQQQKSIISQAFKRIIFGFRLVFLAGAFAPGMASCQASGGSSSVQHQKRMAQNGRQLTLQAAVDSLVVYKSKREMDAFQKGRKLKTYIVSLGTVPEGRKRMQGDNKTPEGVYCINAKNPNSSYHRNLGISYPNAADRQYAAAHKLNTGGDIKIHGLPNNPKYEQEAYLYGDWTWGCIAVSNDEIEELYRFVAVGTVIRILP
jgi:murein L,D-transpeptidase YafK